MTIDELVACGILIFMSWMWYRADKRASDWQKYYTRLNGVFNDLVEVNNQSSTQFETIKKLCERWEGLARNRQEDVEALYTTIAAMEATAKLHADPDKEKRTH